MSTTVVRGEYVCAGEKRLVVEIVRPDVTGGAVAVLQLAWHDWQATHQSISDEHHLVIRVSQLESLDDAGARSLPTNAALAFSWIARTVGPNSVRAVAITASDPRAESFAIQHAAELSTLLLGRQLVTSV